jgi:hypothetical protein
MRRSLIQKLKGLSSTPQASTPPQRELEPMPTHAALEPEHEVAEVPEFSLEEPEETTMFSNRPLPNDFVGRAIEFYFSSRKTSAKHI